MAGTPVANDDIITNIGECMKTTDVPMLFFYGACRGGTADYYVNNASSIETHFVGATQHYLQ